MENSKDDLFKKQIQKAGVESPPPGFTEIVMRGIQLEIQHEMVLNAELKSLLQQNAIEKPSADFMENVMSKVEVPVSKIVIEPIIRKRTWYMVAAACFALVTLLGFYYQTAGEMSNTSSGIINSDSAFTVVLYAISSLPSVYSMPLIATSGLLLMDYFLRNRFLKPVF
jgi:hypothetical protein